MREYHYLAWLSFESSQWILFPEGAMTIGSEVFQALIYTVQAIRNLCSIEAAIGIQ